jgi:hypothetical protein
MATGASVGKATLADAPRLAQAPASAFQDDPVLAWIFLTSNAVHPGHRADGAGTRVGLGLLTHVLARIDVARAPNASG